MKKASLCIFLFVSCSIAQPQWRQVFKTDSSVHIKSLSVEVSQDKAVDLEVIITLLRNDFIFGSTVLSYNPKRGIADTIGINNVNANYCQQAQHTIYTCDNTRWIEHASYD